MLARPDGALATGRDSVRGLMPPGAPREGHLRRGSGPGSLALPQLRVHDLVERISEQREAKHEHDDA